MSNTSPSPCAVDITGARFGRLLPIKREVFTRSNGRKDSRYLCKCDCGKETIVVLSNLTSGTTRSCGCLRKDEVSQRKRKPDQDVALRQIWNYYRRNAKLRGLKWSLTWAKFATLVQAPCHYCGAVGVNETKVRSFVHRTEASYRVFRNNGVDRKNSKLGYTDDNCLTACKRCNIAKSTMTKQEFILWVKKVYNHIIRTKL